MFLYMGTVTIAEDISLDISPSWLTLFQVNFVISKKPNDLAFF